MKTSLFPRAKLVLILTSIAAPLAADTLSLEEAVSLGLRGNFTVLQANNLQRSAENTRKLAGGGLLPRLEVQANTGYTSTNNNWEPAGGASVDGITTRQNNNARLVLNWTLFDGLRMFRAYEAVHKNADLGLSGARLQVENSVVQIASAWLALAARQQALQVMQEAVESSRLRLERKQQRQEAGALSARELLRTRVDLQTDSARLLDGELQLSSAQAALNVALGRSPGTPVFARSGLELAPLPPDTAALLKMVLQNSAELEQLRTRKRSAEISHSLQKGLWWPQVQLNASYGLANSSTETPTANLDNYNTEAIVGLSLRWSILNGFQDQVATANAALEVQNAELELRKRELQIQAQVQELWLRAVTAHKRAQFEVSSVELSKQNLEVAQTMHNKGQFSALEVRDAEQLWLTAQLRYLDALVQAQLSLLELNKLAGTRWE